MSQFQQMQQGMTQVREDLKHKEVEASVGGGMVKVKMNGAHEVIAITIEKEVVNPDDVSMLQDLIKSAVNEASRKSQELLKEELSKITGGLPIPGFNV
ncbi:MAG: YbaB/EbfC family nucleoid-associated protein [Bdellovibrionales bacterium]|nr:YbaB/EbfC family nucleoid-associated protein [Bdellovibrionales bacterium]